VYQAGIQATVAVVVVSTEYHALSEAEAEEQVGTVAMVAVVAVALVPGVAVVAEDEMV
jgi:hypothetical protein